MLGRLEMEVDDCIEAYRRLMKLVFSEKANSLPVDWSGNVKSQYDSRKLRSAVEDVVSRCGLSPNDLLNDGKVRPCRVFVCATAKDTMEVQRLRSYNSSEENTPSPTICEAALATSAATKFFDPVLIGDRQFIDGAFGANNPVEEVEEEACDIWCPSSRNLKDLVKCLLSVGTGHTGQQGMNDNIFKFISKTLVRMAIEPVSTKRRFMARWRNECEGGRCFRFSVEHGLEGVRMTEYHKRPLIETATQDYLLHENQQSQIRECVTNLARKEGKTNIKFEAIIQERAMRIKLQHDFDRSQIAIQLRRPPSWLVPFDRNLSYVDRDVMVKVKEVLFRDHCQHEMAIFGLGGVGKSQIAIELAYQTRDEYPDCSVFWIPAMRFDSIRQAFTKVAESLRIMPVECKENDVFPLICDHLSQRTNGRWLLIFDNADDIEEWTEKSTSSSVQISLRDFLPKSPLGSIFFTTRTVQAAQYFASQDVLHIPEMDEQEATCMLKKLLINQDLINDGKTMCQLLKRLTYLPLAIVQAAAFINQNSTDLVRYIALLDGQEQDVIDLFSEEFEDNGRYKSSRNPVAATWLTSFCQIENRNPLAARYLSFMACLDCRAIPISLLPSANSLEQEKAIGILCAYSFVRPRPGGHCLDLHRLVQLAMRNCMRSTNDWKQWVNYAIMETSQKFPSPESKNRILWQEYLPHILRLLQLKSSRYISKASYILMFKVSRCLIFDSRLEEAESLMLQLQQEYGRHSRPESLVTLSVDHNLAIIFSLQGRPREAEHLATRVLQAQLKLVGPDHSDVAITLCTLASIHFSLSNLPVAEWLAVAAIKGFIRKKGVESYHSLTTIGVLVRIYIQQGRLANASELGNIHYLLNKKATGIDSPDTASSEESLVSIYVLQGRYAEAERLCIQSLEKVEKVLGRAHQRTLQTMNYLIGILGSQGKDADAAALSLEVAQESERNYAPDDPKVRAAYQQVQWYTSLKPLHQRVFDRVAHARKPRRIIATRRLHHRVKLYGGLYCPRRPVTDDTAIQIIKKAVLALPGGLDGVQTVPDKLCNDQGSADKSSDLFEFPYYMSNVPQPQFCFGGGISILAHIFG
ncbi:hypothetical protein N7499_004385 [Penicillium canescens]|nr:uncharacterized protein N7446_005321 [Penicillium canescens]KAJ6039423.1 hypothetical protein N7444_008328 [Penicillium canescens]KAJ6068284.1 hypothetical protein N7446_005321 [Penicillium canescens]KAJ6084756.1 hypothetical protein N7499_004385 [Penicillium canescens]